MSFFRCKQGLSSVSVVLIYSLQQRAHCSMSCSLEMFLLLLLLSCCHASSQFINVAKYKRIVTIGSIESNTLQIIKILQNVGICDQNGQWIAHNTILIQTGNMIGRRFSFSSLHTIELFMQFHQRAPHFNSLFLGILGLNELSHLFSQISGRYKLCSLRSNTKTIDLNQILSSQHVIGRYLRSLPLIRILGKSLFINRVNIMLDRTHASNVRVLSMEQLNNKMFGANSALFSNLFVSSSEFDKNPSCDEMDKILQKYEIFRVIHDGKIHFNLESARYCDDKLLCVNCGISSGGYGALEIDIRLDTVFVHTQMNGKYVTLRMDEIKNKTLLRLSSFSVVSLGLHSCDYIDHDELSFDSISGPYATPALSINDDPDNNGTRISWTNLDSATLSS